MTKAYRTTVSLEKQTKLKKKKQISADDSPMKHQLTDDLYDYKKTCKKQHFIPIKQWLEKETKKKELKKKTSTNKKCRCQPTKESVEMFSFKKSTKRARAIKLVLKTKNKNPTLIKQRTLKF